MDNPVRYSDINGRRSKSEADQIIIDNAQNIKNAASKFGVNPVILASTIYAEQRLNIDWKDDITDGIGFYGVNTSIGVAQVRLLTAKFLEDKGYMPKITVQDGGCGGWNIPGIGFVNGTENMTRAKALENLSISIMYATAYLKYFQDTWGDTYSEISGNTAILATLFNIGHENTTPNSNPKANDFGKFAKDNNNYYYVKSLIGV